jgi:hypothetical protein
MAATKPKSSSSRKSLEMGSSSDSCAEPLNQTDLKTAQFGTRFGECGVEFDNDGILFVHGGETLGCGGFQNS